MSSTGFEIAISAIKAALDVGFQIYLQKENVVIQDAPLMVMQMIPTLKKETSKYSETLATN